MKDNLKGTILGVAQLDGTLSGMGTLQGGLAGAVAALGGSLSTRVEIDPTVPDWAKQPNPPAAIESNTTEGWNTQTRLISKVNTIYIYTDRYQDSEGNNVPGIKLGDGLAYVVDLPFIDVLWQEHIANTDIHVTLAEKMFWNNKSRAYADDEELILTSL